MGGAASGAITYQEDLAGVGPGDLAGFFEGWPNPPAPATHLRLLAGSEALVLARDAATGRVVGFITAVGDGVLCAYIPLLEVLPAYRGRGIGTALARRMLARLRDRYMVDLLCDPELQPFYARLGMRPAVGMLARNYARQAGE
ncbi:MAG TPA: GNAT family N-acetyltransferase [Thermomicrobiales bacterium]|nr:GNAT family N-acetyltransferase [Thermomicrobiales bacterium]